jgi:hypothetical protein
MRPFIMLALTGCATSSDPYDEAAQTLAADITTDVVALDDVKLLARGQLPDGFAPVALGIVSGSHGDVSYMYQLICFDRGGSILSGCDDTTSWVRANVMVRGADFGHEADWTLRGVSEAQSMTTGTTSARYDGTFVDNTATVLYGEQAIANGTLAARLERDDVVLDAAVVFERADRARIAIDDRTYWLDPTTGELEVPE